MQVVIWWYKQERNFFYLYNSRYVLPCILQKPCKHSGSPMHHPSIYNVDISCIMIWLTSFA